MESLNFKIAILEKKIGDLFAKDKTGHNIDHLKRTMNNALFLQRHEGGDIEVVAISAFLHDIHRIMTDDQRNFVLPRTACLKLGNFWNLLNLQKNKKNIFAMQ